MRPVELIDYGRRISEHPRIVEKKLIGVSMRPRAVRLTSGGGKNEVHAVDLQRRSSLDRGVAAAVLCRIYGTRTAVAQSWQVHLTAPLHSVAVATSVRARDGRIQVIDGPFAETREQLGGYYMIEAANLDEAISIATQIPAVTKGTIEVRPVVELPGLANLT